MLLLTFSDLLFGIIILHDRIYMYVSNIDKSKKLIFNTKKWKKKLKYDINTYTEKEGIKMIIITVLNSGLSIIH